MQDLLKSEGDQPQPGLLQDSSYLTREVLFKTDLLWLEDRLRDAVESGFSIDHALVSCRQLIEDRARHRYAHIWNTKLPWWCAIRSPISTTLFVLRRKGISPTAVALEDLERLDLLLARAEFSVPLAPAYRTHLRNVVSTRKLTHWQAVSMVRSLGCRISKLGEVAPNPIDARSLAIGTLALIGVGFLCAIFGSVAIAEIFRTCVRGCVLLGSIQITVILAYTFAVVHSLTFERRSSARRVESVFGVL